MNPSAANDKDFIQRLSDIIAMNMADESFGGMELAKEAGISRTNLNRKLKAGTKMSASHFIRKTRLQKAMEMLQHEEWTVSEIAYKVGFSSPAHFNHCFHKLYGITPGDAKKKALLKKTGNAALPPSGNPNHSPGSGKFTAEPVKNKFHTKRKVMLPLSMILILCSSVSIFFWCRTENSSLIRINREKSIAVLPFMNDSRDTANLFFVNGIAEAITDKLANISDLKVTSRYSSEKYRKNTSKSIRQIARELHVKYVVEGSGQKIGDEVLISVQLIDARSDKHLLSQQFTRKYEDAFSLYSEIALAVAGKIRALITPEERDFIKYPSSGSLSALRLYIRADEYSSLKDVDTRLKAEYIREAEGRFRKAIQLDSGYSDAWVKWGSLFLSKGKPDSSLILAERALQYNPENSEAWLLKGQAYCVKRDGDNMKESLKSALKLDPDDPWAVHWMGAYHYYRGEFSKAFGALLRTREMIGNLQPGFSGNQLYKLKLNTLRLARCMFAMGFYDEGKKFLDEWLELSEDDVWGYNYNLMWADILNGRFEETYQRGLKTPEKEQCLFYMATDLLFLKRYSESADYFSQQIEMDITKGIENPSFLLMKGYAQLMSGQKMEAHQSFEDTEKSVRTRLSEHPEYARPDHYYATTDRFVDQPWFILACIYAVRDDRKKALEYLRLLWENYPASDFQVVFLLKNFPMFDNIRNEPEFKNYLKEAEIHYLEEHAKVEELLRKEGIIR